MPSLTVLPGTNTILPLTFSEPFGILVVVAFSLETAHPHTCACTEVKYWMSVDVNCTTYVCRAISSVCVCVCVCIQVCKYHFKALQPTAAHTSLEISINNKTTTIKRFCFHKRGTYDSWEENMFYSLKHASEIKYFVPSFNSLLEKTSQTKPPFLR